MTAENQSDDSPQFKNRRYGLIFFGSLQILMGCGYGLLFPLMMLAGQYSGSELDLRMMVPGLVFSSVFAVVLVWLGGGSILARRWARALTLVLAWIWLVTGVLMLIMISLWMPGMSNMPAQGQQLPPQAMIIFQVVMLGTMGCMYIVLPGIFVLFYRSSHVKATCEFMDHHVRWTDKCPLPVLALSLMMGSGAASIIFTISSGCVVPFFGMILKGVPGVVVIFVIFWLLIYLAWATYKLKIVAWWITLVTYVAFGVSSFVTFSRFSMLEFYREMNFPEEQMKLLEKSGMLEGSNIPSMMCLSSVALVGYLLWIRRYFVASSAVHADS